ncbi:MAG: thiamine pyrophosphate-binding protein [Pseudomonadota bacterium]
MNGAEVRTRISIAYGVETIFGVPGDPNVRFYETLQLHEDAITLVRTRDERSAGFMAGACGRFADKPGIVECPPEAGAMHSLPSIAERNAAGEPVLLLTIDIPLPGARRGVLTQRDFARLL